MALISDLAAWGVPRLLFSGGEPLMREDLLELVAYARERGIQPSLLTNGTLLSRERAAELKRAGLHSVSHSAGRDRPRGGPPPGRAGRLQRGPGRVREL